MKQYAEVESNPEDYEDFRNILNNLDDKAEYIRSLLERRGALKSREEVFRLVLSHVTVVRIVNGVAHCICPGHKDDKPSLHISMGERKLFSIVKRVAAIREILDALGVGSEELYYDYYNRSENIKRVSKKAVLA